MTVCILGSVSGRTTTGDNSSYFPVLIGSWFSALVGFMSRCNAKALNPLISRCIKFSVSCLPRSGSFLKKARAETKDTGNAVKSPRPLTAVCTFRQLLTLSHALTLGEENYTLRTWRFRGNFLKRFSSNFEVSDLFFLSEPLFSFGSSSCHEIKVVEDLCVKKE